MADLGRLESVDLREAWQSEPGDFTPWLGRPENLKMLGETLRLDLELTSSEASVGPYRADLACVDLVNDSVVLIENQLEKSDHTHLGQLLTYAAGLDAVTIVWVAKEITDQHRAALDWLNEQTPSEIAFFGLEVELWRIGNSPLAPKFNVVSEPNEWVKQQRPRAVETGDRGRLYLDYWQAFKSVLSERGSQLKTGPGAPHHWLRISIGRSGFTISAVATAVRSARVSAELYLDGKYAESRFEQLRDDRSAIEADFGDELDWQDLPGKKACRIAYAREDMDMADRDTWPEQHDWLADQVERFYHVFHARVADLRDDIEEDA